MIRLELDFAHPRRRLRVGDLAFLAAGVLALAAVGFQHRSAVMQRDVLDAARVQLEDRSQAGARGSSADPAQSDLRALAGEISRVNAVAARLAVPWDLLFADLEAAAGQGVTLLGFEPEAEARRLRITARARRFEDMTAYLRRLEATDAFDHAFLTAHEAGDRGAVTFTLTADWVRSP
jgi:Tfp pilus assembly protein PilN